MAVHKMHMGVDNDPRLVFYGGSVHDGTLRKSIPRGHSGAESYKGLRQMSYWGHKMLQYALILPMLFAFSVGMVVDGAFRLSMIDAKFEAKVMASSIEDLTEIEII